MACGLPVVASRIPSHESFAARVAELVPATDVGAFAAAAEQILSSPRRWGSMRRRGIETAQRFSEDTVATTLDKAARWAAEGEWGQAG